MAIFISGLYLAAGLSTRMEGGCRKLHLPLSRGTLLEYSLANLLKSSVDEVIIVIDTDSFTEKIVRQTVKKIQAGKKGRDMQIVIAVNDKPERGMASSVKICLEHVSNLADGYLFMLADMPFISDEVVDEVAKYFRSNPGKNIVPFFDGIRGHPVIVSRRWKQALMTGKGDFGGRKIIRNNPDDVLKVDVRRESMIEVVDIDTRTEYLKTLEHELPRPLTALLKLISNHLPGYISISGGGGKTSLMKYLGPLLASAGKKELSVVMTTTTKLMGPEHADYGTDTVFYRSAESGGGDFFPAVGKNVLWLGESEHFSNKYLGPGIDEIARLIPEGRADAVLIETDGSAGRPVKVPGPNEPVIPSFSDICIAVMGVSALGKAINASTIHRMENYIALTDEFFGRIDDNKTVTAELLAFIANNPTGTFKNAPAGALKILVLNQCDSLNREEYLKLREFVQKEIKAPDAIVFSHMEPYTEIVELLM